MNCHTQVEEQIKHLADKKNVMIKNKNNVEVFLKDIPYGLTIQQVKYFFKCYACGDYKSYPFEKWEKTYNELRSDSFKMFNQIVKIESRLKNYIFQVTYNNSEKVDIVVESIKKKENIVESDDYYKLINTASMGELITVLEQLYNRGFSDTLTIDDMIEIFDFDASKEIDLQKFRTMYSKVYLNEYIRDQVYKEEIKVSQLDLIQRMVKMEITLWIKQAVYQHSKGMYLNHLYPNFLKFLFSNKIYNELVKKENVESRLFIKKLNKIINLFNSNGKLVHSEIENDLKLLTELVYAKLQTNIDKSFKLALKNNEVERKEWLTFLEKKNLSMDYILKEIQKKHDTIHLNYRASFNSTTRILRIYKQFRDQIAHGKTISDTLKTSNDIKLKNFALKHLVTDEYNITLHKYLSINQYWENR